MAQSLDPSGVTDTFSGIYNPRLKTFVRASSDPNDVPFAPWKGNDDGFTGTNQIEAYRETDPTGLYAVLAHQEGRPGFMGSFFRNFWGGLAGIENLPWENTRAQIHVDDVLMHDLPIMDYFRRPGSDQIAPWIGPLTDCRAGGHITFSPVIWEDKFKLRVAENWFSNAARFHRVCGTLGTWDDVLPVPDINAWNQVANLAQQAGGGTWPHATPRTIQSSSLNIPMGSFRSIQLTGPATLLEFTCSVGAVSEWSDLVARFTFDNQAQPSVDVPLRVLGGIVRPPFTAPVSTLLMHNDGLTSFTNYWPMHFATGANLEIHNVGTTGPIKVSVDYAVATGAHPEPWGYFTATHDAGITQTGVAFPGPQILDAHGMLRMVMLETSINNTGAISGNISLMHMEGDLCVRINGNKGDDHIYAAGETSMGHWGWYDSPSDVPFERDCSFHTGLQSRLLPTKGQWETNRLQGSTLVFDPVHFVDGIDIVMEHGPGNEENADYMVSTFLYIRPGAARNLVTTLDVGDAAEETLFNATFQEAAPAYTLTEGFFRDTQYQTLPVQDTVRVVGSHYTFDVADPNLPTNDAFAIGVRLDRDRPGPGGICQADVFVDGAWAGLIHSSTSNQFFRWKEGGELEVEIPRSLTRNKTQFTVELRPRAGAEAFNLARVWVYAYP